MTFAYLVFDVSDDYVQTLVRAFSSEDVANALVTAKTEENLRYDAAFNESIANRAPGQYLAEWMREHYPEFANYRSKRYEVSKIEIEDAL